MKMVPPGLIIILFLLSNCTSDVHENKEKKPNIIYILADDMGYGDLSSLNPDSKIPTPHMDRIVEEGIYFTDAHAPSAVCTPTRYGILTGRYCFRTPLTQGVLVGHSPSLLEPGRITVADLLKSKGYQTACIGKWHLGLDWKKLDPEKPLWEGSIWNMSNTSNVDYQATVDGGPADHGFDYSYIIPASLDIPPYVYLENEHVVDPNIHKVNGIREGRGLYWRKGDASEGFNFYQTLPHLTEKALQYIEQQDKKQPFFLYFPLTAPHTPWVPTEQYQNQSESGEYGDFVVQVDAMIGRILDKLDENGMSEHTLIIVTSDNGSHWKPEDIAQYSHQANFNFRGMKSDIWEGGHRVPFIARWPAQVTAGTFSNQLTVLTDLLATCADLTHSQIGYNTAEDSYSILPALTGKSGNWPTRKSAILHSINGTFALRKGNWKYIEGKGSGGWSSTGKDTDPPGQLYDLANDVSENQNLYEQYPGVVKEMQQELDMYRNEGRSRY